MSPGPKFADESGQERRGAAAQIGGGYIGNVTTPEASLSREGICGSVDSRGSLAGRNRISPYSCGAAPVSHRLSQRESPATLRGCHNKSTVDSDLRPKTFRHVF